MYLCLSVCIAYGWMNGWMDEWMDGYCHWKENVTKSQACILFVNQL